jgi:hypothetical protein
MTENTVFYLDEEIEKMRAIAPSKSHSETASLVRAAIDTTFPAYVGIVEAVVYNEAKDVYVMKFGKSSYKTTPEVATFLLTHRAISNDYVAGIMLPTVNAHLTGGVVDAVGLTFLSRNRG